MSDHILITGGAGFIGSHLADLLVERGHRVRALDNLTPQVHGESRERPGYLRPEVDLIVGDVRERADVDRALDGVDKVVHLAAAVGVGQSMYEIEHYSSVNTVGTAVLLEALIEHPPKRLVVASSMSVYGEGACEAEDGSRPTDPDRSVDDLRAGRWKVHDDRGRPLSPLPTTEDKLPALSSVYALTKYDQERLCLITGRAYSIPTIALRLFNVYGTRQALSNPYTGVLAIFLSRLLNGNAPLIYEDGEQLRDFVSVKDVARAFALALDADESACGRTYNIGSGERYSVSEIAARLAKAVGDRSIEPRITGKYRVGDVRNCFADISLARRMLGYEPRVSLDEGLKELAEWQRDQTASDRVDEANSELAARGLTI